jgi:NAD(P)-dependent dehydrogenase (short-subunit alcohol dehydrogenase family)
VPHVVIANAGISIGMDTSVREDLEVLQRVMSTNVMGMAATFHPFIEAMKSRAAQDKPHGVVGTLVGIASVAGIRGMPGHAAYCASKAAAISYCESLRGEFVASGVVVYVMVGSGTTACGMEEISWQPGDVFVLPGNVSHLYSAGVNDAVLWIVTNEPQLAFEHLRGPVEGNAPTELVHFPAQEIAHQIDLLYEVGRGNDIAGSALIFSSTQQEASRSVLPTLMVAMNSLPPGGSQRSHRHNSIAVTLVIEGDQCHSMVDGRRKDWSQWATTVTPPTAAHSHANDGDKWAKFLIIQDGGIYNYTRALGFEFA